MKKHPLSGKDRAGSTDGSHPVLWLVLCLLMIFIAGCSQPRKTYRYLIPDGYIGYVQVNFKVSQAPPLTMEDGFYLIKFPPAGVFSTSSDMISDKFQKQEYFYYSGESRRRCEGAITGFTRQEIGSPVIAWIFFIGTAGDLERYKSLIYDAKGRPRIGPLREPGNQPK